MPEFLTLLGMLAATAAILALAYYCTRFIAARGAGGVGTSATGRRLRVLDKMMVGRDVKLLVTQAGIRYFLLAVSPSGVDMLAELTAEEAADWLQEAAPSQNLPSFREAFLEQLKQKRKK